MKFLNFLPNEALFYNLINELAKQAKASSEGLHAYVQHGDATRQPMTDARSAAKIALATLVEEVCRAFITPFDREDVQELAEALYRISAMIDTIQQRMHIHHLHSLEGDFQRMAEIIVKQGALLVSLIEGLNRNDKASHLQEIVTLLYELEDEGDRVALELEHALFKHEPLPDALNLIVRKDLYQSLEGVTDAFRDVAATALRIILKHS